MLIEGQVNIETAKEAIKKLWTLIPDDPGAPFEPQIISALQLLLDQDKPEWARTENKLKKYGVNLNHIQSALKNTQSNVSSGELEESKYRNRIDQLKANYLPIPNGVVVPKKYHVVPDGVYLEKEDKDGKVEIKKLLSTPVVISARTDNLDNEQVGVELHYWDWESRPKTTVVSKRQISDKGQILALADMGIGVNSLNSTDCIIYFDKLYTVGKKSLPRKYVTGCTGWLEYGGVQNFLLGKQVFRPHGLSKTEIHFEPRTEPSRIVSESMRIEGNLENWLNVTRPLTSFRYFVLAMGVGFGSPLIKLIQTNNMIVHFEGESTKGKTTILMFIASIFGFPGDSTRKDSLIAQYRTTDNGAEARAEAFNDIPLLMDEAHQADEKTLLKIIYMFANGSGKNRAFQTGEGKPTKNWNNLIASTGEKSLYSSTNVTTTGQEVRCVGITKSPFDEDDTDKREFVDNLRREIQRNYGHAGAIYLQEIVDIINDDDKKNSLHANLQQKIKVLSGEQNSQFHARISQHYAVMWLGVEIANSKLALFENEKEIEDTFINLYKEAGEKWTNQITTNQKAIKYIWDTIESQEIAFSEEAVYRIGHRCSTHGYENAYAFIESKLNQILEEGGFDANTIKRYLKESKFVVLDKEGYLAQSKFGGVKKRRFIFHRELLKGKVDLYEDLTAEEIAEQQDDNFYDLD